MFALVHQVHTEELYLTGGLSYKSLKEHEIARNGDMIDFCTTTYSSISNRVRVQFPINVYHIVL